MFRLVSKEKARYRARGDMMEKTEKEAYEAYLDRLSMEPCMEELTEEEIEQLKKEGRI